MDKLRIKELSDKAYSALCGSDFTTAVNCYNEVLTIDPDNSPALHFASILLNFSGKYRSAYNLLKKLLDKDKCNAEYYVTLSLILKNLDKYEQAVEAIRVAHQLKPRDPIIISNAAMLLADERRYDRAKDAFEIALDINPEIPFIHFNYSLLLLKIGDFTNGWKEYEWRIPFHYNSQIPTLPNVKDLKDKKIQIMPEQGYGDFIMFSRYFDLLEKEGAKVFVNCPHAIYKLYDCHYTPRPDYTFGIASLPLIFNSMPNKPYIKAPGIKKIDENNNFKIGIATNAVKEINNSAHVILKDEGIHIVPHPGNLSYYYAFKRSLFNNFFTPIVDMDGVNLYNLQIDVKHDNEKIINLRHRIGDFSDLADFVDQMDLIITIDTALAHLAGAMGKPVWLLLPYDCDWRWQTEGERSIWYPSMRIFRQPKRGDWETIQTQIIDELKVNLGLI